MRQAGTSRVSFPMGVIEFFFSIYLILPAAWWPWVDSASNGNEYQKQKIFSLGGEDGGRLITSRPSVSRLSKKCGILDVSQPCSPLRPVTGKALLLSYVYNQFPVSRKSFSKSSDDGNTTLRIIGFLTDHSLIYFQSAAENTRGSSRAYNVERFDKQ
jgi:hypothetical protein